MARKDTPSSPLPDDVAGLDLSPEAAQALAEMSGAVPAQPVAAPAVVEEAPAAPTSATPTRPSAAARAGVENPNDTHRVGTAAIPGKIEYVYGDAKVSIKTN